MNATPGGPGPSVRASAAALVLAALVVSVGPRLSRQALAPISYLGVVIIAFALAAIDGAGDGALLYVWPVLWTAYFYGRKATALVVVAVGVAHAAVVCSFPPGLAYFDRWLDVVVVVTVVAVVVQILVRRADQLVLQLERSDARFRDLADRNPDIVFRFSLVPEPHFDYLSPSFERITGIPVATVEADLAAFAARLDATGHALMDDLLPNRSFRPTHDVAFRRADGRLGVFEVHLVETAEGAQGVARDVTEIRAVQAKLAEDATHDPLTGLANRRLLDELLGQALSRAERSGTPLTVAFLDLDGFKAINDLHGHDAGDTVLRATAARLRAAARDADVIARHGGDEFVVVYEGVDDDAARLLVDRIHHALSVPIDIGDGGAVRCRASIGLADTRSTAPSAAALIHAADRAMLEDKHPDTASSRH